MEKKKELEKKLKDVTGQLGGNTAAETSAASKRNQRKGKHQPNLMSPSFSHVSHCPTVHPSIQNLLHLFKFPLTCSYVSLCMFECDIVCRYAVKRDSLVLFCFASIYCLQILTLFQKMKVRTLIQVALELGHRG